MDKEPITAEELEEAVDYLNTLEETGIMPIFNAISEAIEYKKQRNRILEFFRKNATNPTQLPEGLADALEWQPVPVEWFFVSGFEFALDGEKRIYYRENGLYYETCYNEDIADVYFRLPRKIQ